MIFIKKEYRIKKEKEIDKVFKAKKSVGNKFFVIYQIKNDETNHFRFALSIGKKYGNAVSRNKIKRRIREIIRLNLNLLKNKDYVLVVKPTARNLNFEEIEKNILFLLKREENK